MVLVELAVVFVIIALLLSLVTIDPVSRIQQARGSEDLFRFTHTLRTAAESAVMQGKKIAVVIDISDGYYAVYKLDRDDSFYDDQDEEQEPFIKPGYLKDNYIEQIDFEDGSHQLSGELVLYATAQGWDRSVVFSLINDQAEQHKFLRCDRFTTNVITSGVPVELLEPVEELLL